MLHIATKSRSLTTSIIPRASLTSHKWVISREFSKAYKSSVFSSCSKVGNIERKVLQDHFHKCNCSYYFAYHIKAAWTDFFFTISIK